MCDDIETYATAVMIERELALTRAERQASLLAAAERSSATPPAASLAPAAPRSNHPTHRLALLHRVWRPRTRASGSGYDVSQASPIPKPA